MTGNPDLIFQYQTPSNALHNMNRFRAQNPLLTTPLSNRYAPSSSAMPSNASSAPEYSPATSNTGKFDPSRLHIPSTAYSRGQPPHHQQSLTGHMPSVASTQYLAQYHPLIYREPLECVTYKMVFDRIYLLLRDNLPGWWTMTHEALHHLTCKIQASCFTFHIANAKQ